MDWAQLRDLDAGTWFGPGWGGCRVPSLDELLDRYGGKAHIHLVRMHMSPGRVGSGVHEQWSGVHVQ